MSFLIYYMFFILMLFLFKLHKYSNISVAIQETANVVVKGFMILVKIIGALVIAGVLILVSKALLK